MGAYQVFVLCAEYFDKTSLLEFGLTSRTNRAIALSTANVALSFDPLGLFNGPLSHSINNHNKPIQSRFRINVYKKGIKVKGLRRLLPYVREIAVYSDLEQVYHKYVRVMAARCTRLSHLRVSARFQKECLITERMVGLFPDAEINYELPISLGLFRPNQQKVCHRLVNHCSLLITTSSASLLEINSFSMSRIRSLSLITMDLNSRFINQLVRQCPLLDTLAIESTASQPFQVRIPTTITALSISHALDSPTPTLNKHSPKLILANLEKLRLKTRFCRLQYDIQAPNLKELSLQVEEFANVNDMAQLMRGCCKSWCKMEYVGPLELTLFTLISGYHRPKVFIVNSPPQSLDDQRVLQNLAASLSGGATELLLLDLSTMAPDNIQPFLSACVGPALHVYYRHSQRSNKLPGIQLDGLFDGYSAIDCNWLYKYM